MSHLIIRILICLTIRTSCTRVYLYDICYTIYIINNDYKINVFNNEIKITIIKFKFFNKQ